MKYDNQQDSAEESVAEGVNSVWRRLETQYPSVLEYMIDNTFGQEALTRYSCWFALERAVQYDKGAQW